ncbi:hypothetical protein ENH_00013530, partial [Eimeria necatrix]
GAPGEGGGAPRADPEAQLRALQLRTQLEAAAAAEFAEIAGSTVDSLQAVNYLLLHAESRHAQVAKSASAALQLSGLVETAAAEAQRLAEEAARCSAAAAAAACADKADRLRREAFEHARGVLRCVAENGAWYQLDSAVQSAGLRLQRSLGVLSQQSPRGSPQRRAAQLMKEGNANVAKKRYLSSAQLVPAGRHVVSLLALARRVEQLSIVERSRLSSAAAPA